MGPITFLLYRILGWRHILCPGWLGLPQISLLCYAAIGLATVSLVLGHSESGSVGTTEHVWTTPALFGHIAFPPPAPSGNPAAGLIRGLTLAGTRRSTPARAAAPSLPPREARSLVPQEWLALGAEPPPAEPLTITGVDVLPSSTSTASVLWSTNFPAISQGAYSVDRTPALWTPPGPSGRLHETILTGLAASTSYTLWLQATDDWGRTATTGLSLRTLPLESPAGVSASASGGRIVLNGQPFFPLALWDVCPSAVSRRIDDGINLFMGDGCGNERRLLARLRGNTFAVTDAANGLGGAPGLIGWYYPDELDGRLDAAPSNSDLNKLVVNPPPGLLTFLTLTNHFYTGADPLPLGRAIYPGLAGLANVLGFDLYPLQNWCRFDRFDAVYRAQRELEALAAGKPTYQWIEARQMDCPGAALDPTPASVRAETWLAIAGGAEGIGYFPNNWRDDIGDEIRDLNAKITELAPALLGNIQAVDTNQDAVKVGARLLNGALYIIAVNTAGVPVEASIHAAGLASRPVAVPDEARQVVSDNDVFTDSFGPLGVHIYIAAPQGWNIAPTLR